MERDKTVREDQETFNEVIELMKEFNGCNISPLFFYNETGGVEWLELVERLECAYVREMAAKDNATRISIQTAQAIFNAELAAKDAERFSYECECVELRDRITVLERALKPVMECRVERIDGLDSPDGEFMTSSEYGVCDADGNEVDNHSIASSLNAVREAQCIMKEGEEK